MPTCAALLPHASLAAKRGSALRFGAGLLAAALLLGGHSELPPRRTRGCVTRHYSASAGNDELIGGLRAGGLLRAGGGRRGRGRDARG